MERKAGVSNRAQIVYDELVADGIVVPTPKNVMQYRADLIAASEPDIRKLVGQFDGVIEDIEIASIRCKQITPANWSSQDDPCIQYAYGGGYVSGSTGDG